MVKEKDFYGKDIAEVIERACKDFGASHDELDIEVIETGSAGIFGLCKRKAHIRVKRRGVPVASLGPEAMDSTGSGSMEEPAAPSKRPVRRRPEPQPEPPVTEPMATMGVVSPAEPTVEPVAGEEEGLEGESAVTEEEPLPESIAEEHLGAIQADLQRLLALMGLPSEVRVVFEVGTVLCTISGPYEEHIVGPEGRTLDSLQYLLRKMVASHLPDRVMLALDAGDFRARRGDELKAKALDLAEQVKADGKTQAIPALNPSERRIVHMALQEDKGVRSRSVGDGLFKKVLIYKPGKGRRPAPRKRRGGQGDRSSED